MESNLLNQMVRGKTIFVPQPQLTPYPVGGFKTPGAGGVKPMFNVYQPVYQQISTGLKQEKKLSADDDSDKKVQEGFGNPPPEPEEPMVAESSSSGKRKIDEDVFKKMQHPIFKVSKVKKLKTEVKIGKGGDSASVPSKSTSSSSEKKYFTF